MPYIPKKRREELFRFGNPRIAGELNFMFCQIAQNYIYRQGESYQNYNDIMGALEGAKLEIYRRLIAPYENKKCEINGDVFDVK
jgi:hypothetical protein